MAKKNMEKRRKKDDKMAIKWRKNGDKNGNKMAEKKRKKTRKRDDKMVIKMATICR